MSLAFKDDPIWEARSKNPRVNWKDIDFKKELTVDEEVPGGSTPSQYGLPEGAKELQDLIEFREMNFAMGNIFKACYRAGVCKHSDRVRDLNKIIWFAERELKRLLNKKEEL